MALGKGSIEKNTTHQCHFDIKILCAQIAPKYVLRKNTTKAQWDHGNACQDEV